jgi:hypothetical protein
MNRQAAAWWIWGNTPMPSIPIGITVAALAEAMQVRAANEPADRLRAPWGAERSCRCFVLGFCPLMAARVDGRRA